ncbi:hypothetical protein CNMCM7691_001823 [Aspergillus felis]|uniref:Polyketide synthase n=1 Tax=Aspergillus felis TaxID=1287682 RepID=A0A8H6R0N5_9EURO|nr:hypothetical protein CNMCM7691_001823 [Aspergillus felis]
MHQDSKTMPIAIVGMAGRFPGEAHNPSKLWDMMVDGRDAWSPIPSTRFNHKAFYHPDPARNGASNVKGGFFMEEDLGLFDAPFFGMTKAEAEALDPQQRLLLECTYEAFENAGVPMASISGEALGVFVGCFCKDWGQMTMTRDPDAVPMYQATGSGDALLANRLSYFFNLVGPSVMLDTACSSSMVALHLACTAIRAGDCRGAVVAGANALLNHDMLNPMTTTRFLSPDGRSYSYDSRANGYGRGEGVAALVLKPLEDALRDGDCVRAVIRNTGCNQDGRTPGITFPSAKAQAALLRRAHADAGLNPAETTYAECHGTGTQAGDPIEAAALSDVFCGHGGSDALTRAAPLVVGSVKTNVGHLEGAAGVAGLVKTVMMLEHQTIVPNAGFQNANERIPLKKWKLEIPQTTRPWMPTQSGVLRASVSGFGFGGTNACAILDHTQAYLASLPVPVPARIPSPAWNLDSATNHVSNGYHTSDWRDESAFRRDEVKTLRKAQFDIIGPGVEEAPQENGQNGHLHSQPAKSTSCQRRIFPLSAFNAEAGSFQASRLASYLEARSDDDNADTLADLAHTLIKHRSLLPYRGAFVARTPADLVAALQASNHAFKTRRTPPGLAFVFTGQGAAWFAMGRELLAMAPPFARSLARCDAWLRGLGADWSATEELCREQGATRVGLTRISQPLCTAVQLALVDLLADWAVNPVGVVGHSSGEIAAAYAAGLISGRAAMAAAYFRGVAASQPELHSGGMAAVAASETKVRELLGELQTHNGQHGCDIACYNSPLSCTVSGPAEAISELVNLCKSRELQVHKLPVNVAYHSLSMQAVAEGYRTALMKSSSFSLQHDEPLPTARAPMFSSVSGERLDEPSQLGADYWVENLVQPVRFCDALSRLCQELGGKSRKRDLKNNKAQNAAPVDVLVEIGPHSALAGPIRQILQAEPALSELSYLSVLRRGEDAHETALNLAAALFEKGFAVDLSRVNQAQSPAVRAPLSNGHANGHVNGDKEPQPRSEVVQRSVLVDLPSYPWNHGTRYWAEPRESYLYRMRKEARHDLLGAIVRFNNPLEPRWRNWMRVSELPWLRHHRVQGLTVYPAAGFLCMAIEAARQHAAASQESGTGAIGGFDLREVVIGQALVIPDSTDEVETMLSLRPSQQRGFRETGSSASHVWSEFLVTSCGADGKWSEHCRGLIAVRSVDQYSGSSNEVSGSRLAELEKGRNEDHWRIAKDTCTDEVDPAALYDRLTAIGLEYGPSFRNLTRVRHDGRGSEALGTITVPDMCSHMPMQHHSAFIVHPAFLDACLHAVLPLRLDVQGAVVPTFISSVHISAGISQTPGEQFDVAVHVDKANRRQTVVSLSGQLVGDKTTQPAPTVRIDGLTLTSLAGGDERSAKDSFPIKKCLRPLLKPDPDFLTSELLSKLCAHLQPLSPEAERADLLLLEEMGYIMAERALAQVPDISHIPQGNEDRAKLYRSLTRLRDDVHTGCNPHDVKAWIGKTAEQRAAVWEQGRNSTGDEGIFVALVGDHLPAFLRDEVDVLSVVTRGDALGRYYANNVRMRRSCEQAAIVVDLLAHQNPSLRVLEIGAGTGGATMPILEKLAGSSGSDMPRFVSYDFTDVSPGFFGPFQAKMAEKGWEDLPITYRKLDIETDPVDQGFVAGTYDLIVASNVLHATKDLERTMRNTRHLLRPGGTLVLVELMRKPYGGVGDLFGIFPGWWVAEEAHRQDSPLLDENGWNEIFQRTGFSGLKAAVWDTEDSLTHKGTTLVTTAVAEESHQHPATDRCFRVVSGSGCPSAVVGAVCESLGSMGPAQAFTLEQYVQDSKLLQQDEHTHTIFLELGSSSMLRNPNEASWEAIKSLATGSEGILWVTRGACFPESSSPDLALASGLLRTLRTEIGGPLVHLDLEPGTDILAGEQLSQTLTRVYRHALETYENHGLRDGDSGGDPELEFIERNSTIQLLRFTEDTAVEHFVTSRAGVLRPSVQSMNTGTQAERRLKVEVAQLGMLDSLYFGDDARVAGPLGANEVEIEIRAAGLNFRDVMMAMGQIEAADLGAECAGIVTAVGSAVDQSKMRVGDHVVAPADGALSQCVRVPASRAQHLPDTMTFAEAATLPIVFCTALHSIRVAAVDAADIVLVHAAAGGLGQALIQLCRRAGARILATVGNSEKKRLLVDRYGIAEQDIFWSRDAGFESGVMAATAGKGVNVVFNSLSGELLRASMRCLAPWGRFVELGKRDFAINTSLEMASLAKSISFLTVDLMSLLLQRLEKGSELWESVMNMARRQEIQPIEPIATFGLGDIESAMRTMQAGRHIGKIVLEPRKGESGRVMPQGAPRPSLQSDAAYVLVGGLGGIGRSFASVMVRHLGARHLVFISRSGASTPEAQHTVRDLQRLGAQITVIACDASDKAALKAELDSRVLPPIKGVLHLGLVIKNDLFRNMELSTWLDSLKPKVEATWNLHELLPADMDFFVMLSSMAAILGVTSQAAYNAAGTFQDAFASFRNNQLGWAATTTMDLGMVVGVGYVADRIGTHNRLLAQGFEPIPEAECLALLEACLPARSHSQAPLKANGVDPGNIITGLWPARLLENRGTARALYSAPQFAYARQMATLAAAANSGAGDGGGADGTGQQRIRELLPLAESMADAESLVLSAVVGKLASLLMLPEEEIGVDDGQSMSSYGLDSLVAVEMRNWVASDIQVTVPILEFLGTQSIKDFCYALARKSKLLRKDLSSE